MDINNSRKAVDIADSLVVDTEDNVETAMADEAKEEDGAEDVVHLRRQRNKSAYPKPAARSPHYSVEEQHHSMH